MIDFLKKPSTIFFSFIASGLISAYFPHIAHAFEIPGSIYLSLLQMCILPLIMSSLIKSCFLITSNTYESVKTGETIIKYFILLTSIVIFGVSLTFLIPIGTHLANSGGLSEFLGIESGLKPIYINENDPIIIKQTIADILRTLFTSNIFDSLSRSMAMQVILFSIIVGCSSGFLKDEPKRVFIVLIEAIENIFKRIIHWVMIFLPIGIVLNFSYNFSKLSIKIFVFLIPAVVFLLAIMITIMCVIHFFAARKLNMGYFELLSYLKESLVIAGSTGSPFATMPTLIQASINDIRIKENLVHLFCPLSIATCRFGSALYFSVTSVIVAQMLSIPLGLYEYFVIILLSLFASFAAVSTGIINVGLLAIVQAPIGVPSALAITLFTAIDPFIDPIRTVFTVYMHAFGMCTILERQDDAQGTVE